MKRLPVSVYLTEEGWAYPGVLQRIGDLSCVGNEKLWLMLGALLIELHQAGIFEVTIFNDTRLVEEFNQLIEFDSAYSKSIAVRLHNDYVGRFIKLDIKKLDGATLASKLTFS